MIPQVGDWVTRGKDVARIQGVLYVNGIARRYIVCNLADEIQRWEPDGLQITHDPFEGPAYEPQPAA